MNRTRRILAVSVVGLFVSAPALRADSAPDIKNIPNTVVDLPMTGIVKNADLTHNVVTVQDDFGKTAKVNLGHNVQILKDGKPVAPESLKTGDHITVMNKTE
jgi:hypothetical protein